MKPVFLCRVIICISLILITACAGSSRAATVDHAAIRGVLKADAKYAAGELSIKIQRDPVVAMQIDPKHVNNSDLRTLKECGVNTVSMFFPLGAVEEANVKETKRLTDALKDAGFNIFWITSLTPVNYDRFISPANTDVSQVDWQGKKLTKKQCMNNPYAKEAFAKSMQECVSVMVKQGIPLDGVIMNEPGRTIGEFCYCDYCRKLFKEKYGIEMPLPINMESGKSAIPVDWPAGLPKAKYINESDHVAWEKMSEFYYTPVTERINDIFKYMRSAYPQISCQVTTLTDINPYYGLDFWNGILNNQYLDGIQTAIYWAVGRRSPLTVGDKGTADKFIGNAQKRGLSCYYWLQAYDCGDHSGPMRQGDIQIAVREAFARGVDGVLIWSYLNPIRGPWDNPYDWDKYLVDLEEAVGPYLNKPADKCRIVVNGKPVNGDGTEGNGLDGVYRIKMAKPSDGKVRLTITYPACRPLQQEINIDTAGASK